LLADQIAEASDFFSFGTKDLTQMRFGFSCDDVEGREALTRTRTHEAQSFEVVDAEAVAMLVCLAVQKGRENKPKLKTGVCGEHGGEPKSIRIFYESGVDYVSCSPFRIPVARLAAAQAVQPRRSDSAAGITSKKSSTPGKTSKKSAIARAA